MRRTAGNRWACSGRWENSSDTWHPKSEDEESESEYSEESDQCDDGRESKDESDDTEDIWATGKGGGETWDDGEKNSMN